MRNPFTEQFSDNIYGIYSCFDRVIIRGYIHKLFTQGGLVNFLRSMGFRKYTDGIMRIFTDQLNAHIKKMADKHKLKIVWWPSVGGGKNGKKQEYIEEQFVRKSTKKGNFLYGIIADMERAQSYSTRSLAKKDGGFYDKIYHSSKIVKHYYIYFHDQLLGGPCYLKLCTYFPFNAEVYFNGHNAVRLQLDSQGIGYRMEGNAFTWVEDYQAVQKIAFSLSGQQIQNRINYWMSRCFRFDKGKYSTCPRPLHHEWYCSQVEVCSNLIFKSARFFTNLFERILDKFSRIGQPDSLVQIFKKRYTRKNTKSTCRLYDHQVCIKHWLSVNSIKFYNKLGYLFRIESTINGPNLLGLKKSVLYIQSYLKRGIENNGRLMSRFADVDVRTIPDDEADRFNLPVERADSANISAIDLRKKRQIALLKAILNPKYAVFGFRTSDLLDELSQFFQNCGQIRYELLKLKVRGLLDKVQGKNLYRVTELGFKLLWIKLSSNSYFSDPLITMTYRHDKPQFLSQPSKLEEAHTLINDGLNLIIKELSIRKAA